MNPFETVTKFEDAVAEYTGAPYAIATDCCSNAIFLSAMYFKQVNGNLDVLIPRNTYVSVPMQFKHAGFNIKFENYAWSGTYRIAGTNIVDSACRFTKGMYQVKTSMCLSFQYHKILNTIKGGMILTDDVEFYSWAQRAVHDGRDMSVPYNDDKITMLGYHMFMTPETAALGLERLAALPKHNDDIAGSKDYPSVSYVKDLK